jgi:hypothetical protein
MEFTKKTLSIFILLPILLGCEPESSIDGTKLLGKWFIQNGLRNGIESEAFEGAWLTFESENMVTNLPIPDANFTEIPSKFLLKNDLIIQKPEGVEGVEMKVTGLTDSLLTLDFELRKTAFHLVFGKNAVIKDTLPVVVPN